MNGGEKILSRIKSDCDNTIKEIEIEAQAQCDKISQETKAEIKKRKDAADAKTRDKVFQINISAKSGAELEIRNALLKKRREEIDLTIEMVLDTLLNSSDSEYFDAVLKLASKLRGKSGTIFFNKKDLARLPSDFTESLKKAGLNAEISTEPADIKGGFILKYGDIEENMDFSAIISSRRGELEDLINKELFND